MPGALSASALKTNLSASNPPVRISAPLPPTRVSFPAPPINVSAPAPPLSVSLPARPMSTFAAVDPVRVSLKAEPVRFSNPRQRVRPGAARVLGSRSRQADRYRSSRVFVRHGVGARSTIKNVVGAIAFERVVQARTCQILNPDQRVALGIAATRRSRRQAHRDP